MLHLFDISKNQNWCTVKYELSGTECNLVVAQTARIGILAVCGCSFEFFWRILEKFKAIWEIF